jgi:hypothetical protein
MAIQRIVVFLEGGLIQRIESDRESEVLILGHDTDCGDEERIHPIRDIDGTVEDDYISRWYVEPHPETVEYFFSQVSEEA